MEARRHSDTSATSEPAAMSRPFHPRYRMVRDGSASCQLGWYREVDLRPYVVAGVFVFSGIYKIIQR